MDLKICEINFTVEHPSDSCNLVTDGGQQNHMFTGQYLWKMDLTAQQAAQVNMH